MISRKPSSIRWSFRPGCLTKCATWDTASLAIQSPMAKPCSHSLRNALRRECSTDICRSGMRSYWKERSNKPSANWL